MIYSIPIYPESWEPAKCGKRHHRTTIQEIHFGLILGWLPDILSRIRSFHHSEWVSVIFFSSPKSCNRHHE